MSDMAEHLKLRFARAMTSFQFCRSKDPSTFPEIPSPASYPLCPINPKALDTVYPNLPAPPSTPEHPLHKRRESSKIISIGCSTGSSADHTRKKESQRKKNEQIGTSIRVGGRFCSEGEADRESETLMSSSIKNEIQTAKKARSRGHALRSESTHEARAFMIPCTVHEQVTESFAVVKTTEDPYHDFKRSMLEMILEKQIFETKGLEKLLQCFLSLNARVYHGVIVEAFSDIWEVLFRDTAGGQQALLRL